MPSNHRTIFKRLNFFTGFFTTAEDWLQGQEYHLEKRKLHLRGLHTPGIIPGDGEELKVTAGGGLSVRVGSGAALDREGNLLYLPAAKTIPITLPEDLPKTVYIYIKYAENPTDSQYNVDYPEYSGPARVSENPEITVSPIDPEQFDGVVLASIALQPGVTELIDAANTASPGPNEIDTRAATLAGAVDWRRDALAAQLAAQLAELDAAHLARSQRLHERLQKVHEYHLAKERRHNQGLYRPGLMPDVLDELAVLPVGGLDVEVRPGAALDGAGNELYLDRAIQLSIPPPTAPRRVYILAGYEDRFDAYLKDLESPFDAPLVAAPPGGDPPGGSRYRTLKVKFDDAAPDDPTAWIELAHIDLTAGATEVRLPADPGRPQRNEIDRRSVNWAVSKAAVEPQLPPELPERIIELMRLKRGAFAALDRRFPIPSAADVRQAAVNLETLARNESLRPKRLAEVLGIFATLEQDVGQEIGAAYPPVVDKPEFKRYQDAVAALAAALYARENAQILLNRQSDVVTAARDLSEVVFKAPDADAGADQKIATLTGEADVTLDAGSSEAHADQKIVRYHWDKEE